MLNWPNAVGFLLLVVWFVPIKGYALPVDLPFNLEHYRLTILLLVLALAVSVAARRRRFSLAGRGFAVACLAGAALVSQSLNFASVDAGSGVPGTAIKSLSYFLGYLIVYLIVCSVLDSRESVDTAIRFLVAGGAVVAASALYEARFGFNVFDHLHEWLPGFERQFRAVQEERAGRIRVIASAQHPIAMGVALTLVVPFAFYLAGRARSVARSRLWLQASRAFSRSVRSPRSRGRSLRWRSSCSWLRSGFVAKRSSGSGRCFSCCRSSFTQPRQVRSVGCTRASFRRAG